MQRKYAKRNTKSIYRHMDCVMEELIELAAIFDPQHPDLGDALRLMAKVILQAQSMLAKWYTKVWGSVPSNWYGT